ATSAASINGETPTRTVSPEGRFQRVPSEEIASSASTPRCTNGSIIRPNGVGATPRGERVNSRSPGYSSRVAMPLESAGWATQWARAAAPNEPASRTVEAYRNPSMLNRPAIHRCYRWIHGHGLPRPRQGPYGSGWDPCAHQQKGRFVSALAVQVDAPGAQLQPAHVPVTSPSQGWVRVRVVASGMCGADLGTADPDPDARFPVTPGHEVAGTVAELGPDVPGWQVGDRVAVGWFGGSCGHCPACRRG